MLELFYLAGENFSRLFRKKGAKMKIRRKPKNSMLEEDFGQSAKAISYVRSMPPSYGLFMDAVRNRHLSGRSYL